MILKQLALLALLLGLVGCFWNEGEDVVKPETVNILVPVTISLDFNSCYGGRVVKDVNTDQRIYFDYVISCPENSEIPECRGRFRGKIKTKYGYPRPDGLRVAFIDSYKLNKVEEQGDFILNTMWYYGENSAPTYRVELYPQKKPSQSQKIADTLYIYTFKSIDSAHFISKSAVDSIGEATWTKTAHNTIRFVQYSYPPIDTNPQYNPNCKWPEL